MLVALVVLAPSNVSYDEALRWLDGRLTDLGTPPGAMDLEHVEILANVVMVLPVGVLIALSWPRVGWERWTAWAFVCVVGVESVQGLLLPSREASTGDVVANTSGVLAGTVLVALWRRWTPGARTRPGR